jgi:hypothetical protein
MDICEQHRKHLFLYYYIYSALHNKDAIRLLPAYPLPRECAYRVVAQQRSTCQNMILFGMCRVHI